jgi:Phosphotransferase enzyme family
MMNEGAFDAFTDAQRARDLLQSCSQVLFGQPVTIATCTVIDSLYKTYANPASWPKSTLSVCWRLGLEGGADSTIFYARVYLAGRSQAAWQALGEPAADDAQRLPAVMHLPALDMIVWRFPHDPSIRHLPGAVVEQRVKQRLPLAALLPQGVRAEQARLSIEPVCYQPEKCCTTRYRLQWHDAQAPGEVQQLVIYGKTYSDDRGSTVHARQRHYWRAAAFAVCRPLGYDETIKTVWSLGIEGLPLAQVIAHANHRRLLAQVGRCLAAVHASDLYELGALREISQAELLADCIKKIGKLSRASPPCAPPLALLAASVQCLAALLAQSAGVRRALHGDFHIGQMLACGDDVYVFDFDSFAVGDPERDLAEFIVALLFQPYDPAFVQRLALGLMEAYCAQVRWKVRTDHLRWYALVEFVTRCWRFYRQQQTGWDGALQRSVAHLTELEALIVVLADVIDGPASTAAATPALS